MTNTIPKAPAGLQTRGRRFWRDTMTSYELTDAEQTLLLETCRTLDNLDSLAAAITADGAMIPGSMGQRVMHPALTEARGQRAILHRLIAALALPDDDGASVPTGHSIRGKTANAARSQAPRPLRAL